MSWSKGERAEDYVAAQLLKKGWTIEARNFRRRGFEIDIIATTPQRLICVEVKGRLPLAGHALDLSALVNSRKLQRLHLGMNSWLQAQRFDETLNTEFWLCLVQLPNLALSEGKLEHVKWMRLQHQDCDNKF